MIIKQNLDNALKNGSMKDILFELRQIMVDSKSFGSVANVSGISRENLYKLVSPTSNPSFDIVLNIIRALKFELTINVKDGVQVYKRSSSILKAAPFIEKYWDTYLNNGLDLNDLMASSRKKLNWKCLIDPIHLWRESPSMFITRCKKIFLKTQNYEYKNIFDINICPHCEIK